VQRRNLFQDSNFPKSYLPPIRGSSWHKTEIKMIRRGHYSSNNFQDLIKRKITEKKILGHLPRVLFFRDFYFHAIGSLVVLSFPKLLSFSSVFPKPLSKTLRRSSDGRIPV
jgi:hypothetical protein